MALQHYTSWQGEITDQMNVASATITLQGRRGGSVLTTSGESEEYIRKSGFIPRVGDSHPDNTVMIATRVNVKKERGPNIADWEAYYEWTTPDVPTGSQHPGGVPFGWTVKEGTLVSQHPVDRNIDGVPIRTVTMESPDPPLEEEVYETLYTFTKNRLKYNHLFFDLYRGAVNDDIWLGRSRGTCCITRIDCMVTVQQNAPPECSLEVDVVKRKPSPLYNASATETSNGAAYYSWFKRWRAEGYYVNRAVDTPAGVQVQLMRALDPNGPESTKPVLHSRATGFQCFLPTDAEWYFTQTRTFRPFATFFRSV